MNGFIPAGSEHGPVGRSKDRHDNTKRDQKARRAKNFVGPIL